MSDALGWLADAAARREAAGLHRVMRPRRAGAAGDVAAVQGSGSTGGGPSEGVLDLAGNDYLDLARHPDVIAAGVAALQAFGAGSTGSRLVTGSTVLHEELEVALAAHLGTAEALVFSSGYLANLGAVCALSGPGDLVVSDGGNHASLVDACRLSRARVVVTPHGDLAAVEAALRDRTETRALVVTDAVFSVDGSLAPLGALHDACRRHGAALLVDDAHGLGVVGATGSGAAAAAGLTGEPDVVVTLTLSKSLGSQGGAVVGPAGLRGHLVDTARSFVFDTGLAPSSAAAAQAALGLVTASRVGALRTAASTLAALLGVEDTPGAVVALPVGDPHRAVAAQTACRDQGVAVGCFRPPSVPAGGSCLRLAAHAGLRPADLERAARVVRASLS